MRGTVARLVPAEGFGVIRSLEGDEYFFHVSAMNGNDFDELAIGSYVDFSCGTDSGDRPGELPRAAHVELRCPPSTTNRSRRRSWGRPSGPHSRGRRTRPSCTTERMRVPSRRCIAP
jgi:cold shock CspA family protein